MSAIKLDIDWRQTDSPSGFSAPVRVLGVPEPGSSARAYTRRLSSTTVEMRCPHCESIIYSRRNKLCGVCCEALPAALLFSPIEAERIEDLLKQERQRHKTWMHRTGAEK